MTSPPIVDTTNGTFPPPTTPGPSISSSFGFQGTYSPFSNDAQSKRELDLQKRRVSESRRQRTPMSCDRCKIRKIKCINPNPGPCDYCSRMKFHCQITAQRKHRPLYFTSDEQFQWMIAIIQHFLPDIQLDLEGLKAAGKSLGIENPTAQYAIKSPLRPLPATLESAYNQDTSTPNASENMSEKGQTTEDENEEANIAVEAMETPRPLTETPQQTTPFVRQENKPSAALAPTSSPQSYFPPQQNFRLPPRIVADSYIERYFADVNDLFWVISYKDFRNHYRLLYPEQPFDPVRQVILLLVFAFSSKDAADGACDLYYTQALYGMGMAIERGRGSLEVIQALMLMSLYSMHGIDNIAAWTFAGAAVRIATSIALYRDNDLPWTPDREVPRRVWWSLYDLERFLCANLALPSSINDELVNTSLPSDYSRTNEISIPISPYPAASSALSQIIGRISAYLIHPNLTLPTLCHYLGELQQWYETLPESLRRFHLASQGHTHLVNFLMLRYFDSVIIGTRPFLASLARIGLSGLPSRLAGFFQFASHAASIAAREMLSLLRQMDNQRLIRGVMAFEKHFIMQSATALAISSAVLLGNRDERLRYRESIELLLRVPGEKNERLISGMRIMEKRLEKLAQHKASRTPDAANIFDSPGIPSLNTKQLLQEFIAPAEQQNGGGSTGEEIILTRWIPRRVGWEDVPECISMVLKREGVPE